MNSEFFAKAQENINAAELCFSNNLLNASANRAYYAAYHAAIFALALNGFTDEQNAHEWVQRTFAGEAIHRKKIFQNKFKSYLPELMKVRLNADYSSVGISRVVAERQLKKAKEFLEEIERKCKR